MMIIAAMLALCGGQAMAQRCLPGMSAVEIKADMTDGFYIGSSRDCGYSFGVYYSVFKCGANTWSFGGEYLQTYKPYAEKGRIPVAQFTAEAGYNLHLVSDYSQTFHSLITKPSSQDSIMESRFVSLSLINTQVEARSLLPTLPRN